MLATHKLLTSRHLRVWGVIFLALVCVSAEGQPTARRESPALFEIAFPSSRPILLAGGTEEGVPRIKPHRAAHEATPPPHETLPHTNPPGHEGRVGEPPAGTNGEPTTGGQPNRGALEREATNPPGTGTHADDLPHQLGGENPVESPPAQLPPFKDTGLPAATTPTVLPPPPEEPLKPTRPVPQLGGNAPAESPPAQTNEPPKPNRPVPQLGGNAPAGSPPAPTNEPPKPNRPVPQLGGNAPAESPPAQPQPAQTNEPQKPNRPVPQLGGNAAGQSPTPPAVVPPPQVAVPKLQPRNLASINPPIPRAPSNRVYDRPAIDEFKVNAGSAKMLTAQLHIDSTSGTPVLDNVDGAGQKFGSGANSQVFGSRDAGSTHVLKFVPVMDVGTTEKTMTDQKGGRQILTDIKRFRNESPYEVVKRYGDLETVKVPDPTTNKDYFFVRSEEDSISKQEKVTDNKRADFGQDATVTNARQRIELRPDKKLNLGEELTVNQVMRDLNDFGVVWTDQKMENFDIVKDDKSPTGYRMIFFDLDSFRPVNGDDQASRADTARKLQVVFDSAKTMPEINSGLDRIAAEKNLVGKGVFDYTAFGGKDLGWLATPGANNAREAYTTLNRLQPAQLDQVKTNWGRPSPKKVN